MAYGTNLQIEAVWDANEQHKGKAGILCLMAGGTTSEATRKLLSTGGAAGLVQALDWLGKRRKNLVAMHSVTWEQNPWTDREKVSGTIGGGYFSVDLHQQEHRATGEDNCGGNARFPNGELAITVGDQNGQWCSIEVRS